MNRRRLRFSAGPPPGAGTRPIVGNPEPLSPQAGDTVIDDPLLSPFAMKNLTLRNRIVSTSHEPAYSEDGLPKDRYRAYHVEKARGGVALTMIGGSALVARDSSPAFGNLELWKEEAEPWLRRLAERFPKFAWLNPEPEGVWEYRQSIAVIKQVLHNRMYPVTLNGLERAMRELTK